MALLRWTALSNQKQTATATTLEEFALSLPEGVVQVMVNLIDEAATPSTQVHSSHRLPRLASPSPRLCGACLYVHVCMCMRVRVCVSVRAFGPELQLAHICAGTAALSNRLIPTVAICDGHGAARASHRRHGHFQVRVYLSGTRALAAG